MDPTNMQELMDGNSVPFADIQEDNATNITESVSDVNDNMSDSETENMQNEYTLSIVLYCRLLIMMIGDHVKWFYTTITKGGDSGDISQTPSALHERNEDTEILDKQALECPDMELESGLRGYSASSSSLPSGPSEGVALPPLTDENLNLFRPKKKIITNPVGRLKELEECERNYPGWFKYLYKEYLADKRAFLEFILGSTNAVSSEDMDLYDPHGGDYQWLNETPSVRSPDNHDPSNDEDN
ncbi:hypothetical protein DQ04_09831020 [Trypanosoma grayi]|uniref:hypothetical protein n=1 Tax=Trypanosoma grayi TaxID=71804 RepID=UPI0004F3F8C0|nr:hypothetical protein DQ04_09831020 [Trypanosoma grayi]KEG07431.1 hypothetical protein DQ04_09831020 [Trypanosoma grayi]